MEILSNRFNGLLTQYQETYQDFLTSINSNDDSLTQVPDSAFVGQSNVNTIQGSSADNCLTSCTSTQSCSGATFDNGLSTCTLSTGSGSIIRSNNQVAIVKKTLYYFNQLKELNNALTSLNNTMMQNANSSMNDYSQTQQMNSEKAEILNKNYQTLQQERSQIDVMIRQYETLNSALENGNINVTSNYYAYIMYLFVAIFLVFLFIKTSASSGQVGGGHIKVSPLLLIFLAAVIIFNAALKN